MTSLENRVAESDSAAECYNPSTTGGVHVAAIVIGVIGLLVAVAATILGLIIWFKAEDRLVQGILNLDGTRFFLGLAIIILGNIYGIILIASGKLFHFFRAMLKNTVEMRAQNEILIERLFTVASRLPPPAPQDFGQVNKPPRTS